MPLKKTNAHKLGLVAKTVLSGLGAASAVASNVAWNLLEQLDSKPSVSSNTEDWANKPENGSYGYYESSNNIGYYSNGALYHVDDEGDFL